MSCDTRISPGAAMRVEASGDVHLQPEDVVVSLDGFACVHSGPQLEGPAVDLDLGDRHACRDQCFQRGPGAAERQQETVAKVLHDLTVRGFDAVSHRLVVLPEHGTPVAIARAGPPDSVEADDVGDRDRHGLRPDAAIGAGRATRRATRPSRDQARLPTRRQRAGRTGRTCGGPRRDCRRASARASACDSPGSRKGSIATASVARVTASVALPRSIHACASTSSARTCHFRRSARTVSIHGASSPARKERRAMAVATVPSLHARSKSPRRSAPSA